MQHVENDVSQEGSAGKLNGNYSCGDVDDVGWSMSHFNLGTYRTSGWRALTGSETGAVSLS